MLYSHYIYDLYYYILNFHPEMQTYSISLLSWRISHTLWYWLHRLILKANKLPSPWNENYRLQRNSSNTHAKDYLQYTTSNNINCCALFSKNANVNHFFFRVHSKKKNRVHNHGSCMNWGIIKIELVKT